MSRQEILNTIDKWVSEGSGWVIDQIDSHYLNVTLYKPLSGSSYIKLPAKLGNSRKALINLKNEDNECFRWCHIRHLNPQEKNPQRIKKEDKIMIEKLDYSGIEFPILFTNTDSLTYEIETEDVYKDLWKKKDLFDNSDYPKGSKYEFQENKKVIEKFKDESCGNIISEFVGLRSKMYSYVMEDGKGGMIAKGIKKNVIKKNIMHEDYKRTLMNEEQMRHNMRTIRSVKHKLQSFEINKISPSCFDDKRYILNDGINSYAYGHYKIN